MRRFIFALIAFSGCQSTLGPPATAPLPLHTADTATPEQTDFAGITQLGVVHCDDPSARQNAPFEWVGNESGDWNNRIGGGASFGVAAADVNSDGFLDLALSTSKGVQLFLVSGDLQLTDVSSTALPPSDAATRALSFADVDADGDMDLFVGRLGAADSLWINDGSGQFTDETELRGPLGGPKTMASSWADADGDGDLDLMIANGASTLTGGLYLNNGTGQFTSAMNRLPVDALAGPTFAAVFTDLDVDGQPDLYLVNDAGGTHPNRLLWNRGGVFVDDIEGASGLNLSICGMGAAIEDLTGDDTPDLLLSDWENLLLMESMPEAGVWVDSSVARGLDVDVSDRRMPWGVGLHDLDNDGDLDAIAAHGSVQAGGGYVQTEVQRTSVFRQEDDHSFTEVGLDWGVTVLGRTRSVIAVDLNNDGWLDLVQKDLDTRAQLYRANCDTSAWLRISLQQTGTNPHAIGARVWVQAGDRRWSRTVKAGGLAVGSGGPAEVHFGLGEVNHVDRIEVQWPDGEVQTYGGPATRQQLVMSRIAPTP